MLNPESLKSMEGLSEKINDHVMLDEQVRNLAEKVYVQEPDYENINDMVVEAFTLGLTLQLKSGEEIERIKGERFIEDEFSYQKWQLELYRYREEVIPEISCAELKSNILRKGLLQLSDKFVQG